MKQVFLALLFCGNTLMAVAQADTTLKEYIGRYSFPEGSFVTSAEVVLEGDVLAVTSAQGGSPLEKRGKDTFALINYEGGMIYFSRNEQGKVARVKVEVQDILLEGAKEGVTAWFNRRYYFDARPQLAAR